MPIGYGYRYGSYYGANSANPFFDKFANLPSSKKITLVEILLGERLNNTGTANLGFGSNFGYNFSVSGSWGREPAPNSSVYSLSYFYEDISLSSGFKSRIVKKVEAVKSDAVSLTAKISIAEVQATANSFWHDTATKTLYLNTSPTTPDLSPNLIVYFTLSFSDTPAVIYNNRYYEPYLLSTPAIRTQSDNILSGHTTIGGGSITLANGDGFFDSIFEKYIWTNRQIKILYGTQSLLYSQYEPIFTGAITDKKWSSSAVTLTAKTVRHKLQEKIPAEVFTVDDYPNLDTDKNGHSIPFCFGVLQQRNALEATAIDTLFATDQVKFKITSHAISAVNSVFIDYGNGLGEQNLALDPALGLANSYKIDSLALSTIIVRFSAGGYKTGTTRIKCAISGKLDSQSNLMLRGAEMAEDILLNFGSFTTPELDSTAFSLAKSDTDFTLGFAVTQPTRLIDLIDKIANSEIGRFQIKRDGRLTYSLWVPERPQGLPLYDESDLIGEPVIDFKSDEHFTSVSVGYSKSAEGENLFEVASSIDMKNRYGNNNRKSVETFLTSPLFARILAERLLILHETPHAVITGKTKWRMANENLGSKIQLSLPRAPASSASYDKSIFELTSLSRDSSDFSVGFVARYLSSIATTVGIYTIDSAPDFDNATEADKLISGFYTDDNGYASASLSPNSYMISRYW